MRVIEKGQLPTRFHREGGLDDINDSTIIIAYIAQYYVRFREKKDSSVRPGGGLREAPIFRRRPVTWQLNIDTHYVSICYTDLLGG